MKLHENKKLFSQAIRATAQRMNILDIYIEKDYWVCYALHLIFNSELKDKVIFKGGTALSKCYNLIERFSEDIDLVLLTKGNESGNQLKKKLKQVTEILTDPFIEEDVKGITNKVGMIRKIAYNYPKVFKGTYGQVRDRIILEASWLGHFEPYGAMQISSYIYDTFMSSDQETLAKEYGLTPFNVLVLDVKRTLCEKIMSLVRFSHTENPITDLNNKVRHIYDIHMLLTIQDVNNFFNSTEFDDMLTKVAQDDVTSFRNNNEWLAIHPKKSILFESPENTWNQLEQTYNQDFKNLVYGKFPESDTILTTLKDISRRLTTIKWNINI